MAAYTVRSISKVTVILAITELKLNNEYELRVKNDILWLSAKIAMTVNICACSFSF